MVGARRVHGLVVGNLFAAFKLHLKGSPCRAFVEGMKVQVADNYWGEGATTLEWTVSSPPPFHTFEVLPRIR